MITDADLQSILTTADDLTTVAEIYSSDQAPTAGGFDPNDALWCVAGVTGVSYMGVEYDRMVTKFGAIERSIKRNANTASITLDNTERRAAAFEFEHGFEGLILVIRLISRSRSTSLAKSMVLFAGRCEKPASGSKKSLTVSAKFILDSIDVTAPRRRFNREDPNGRVPSDPLFEGFNQMPKYGSTTFPRQERRGGFLGWWNKKQVLATLQWSQYSSLDGEKSVPLIFGRAQIMGVIIGAVDTGPQLRFTVAFCEGPIQDIANARSTNPNLPMSGTSYAERLGLVGTLNGPVDSTWPGSDWLSRTAHVRGQADNSLMEVDEPPPDIVAVIFGMIVTVPDSSGVWNTEAWSDNGAAIVRWLLTNEDFFNLDANWIDDEYFAECYAFNAEEIFDTSADDFTFVEEG